MKIKRSLAALLILAAFAAGAAALEPVEWNAPAYAAQFNFFSEKGYFNKDSWAALSPTAQGSALAEAAKPAAARQKSVKSYYSGAECKWTTARLLESRAQDDAARLKAVRLWLGAEKGAALERKLAVTRAKLTAAAQGLNAADLAELEPYLLPEALAWLRAMKPAQDSRAQARGSAAIPAAGPSSAALAKFAGDPSSLNSDGFSRLYDGNNAAGAAPAALGANRSPAPAGERAAPAAETRRPAVTVPGVLPQTAEKSAQAAGGGSQRWTSDAYGVTVYVANRTEPLTFRQGAEAAAAIRALPDRSVTRIIFYGHGSPGLQTVGSFDLDAEGAAAMMKDKMAPGGLLQFSGCNTSSIGGATLNPLVGLSMAARRLLYFSLPYFQDRADGVPAEQARRQWDGGWNADLARDTSLNLRGVVVCGYRTFGLVAGRLPGVTRVVGNQEAVTPGYVAGKQGCYKDGREVPAP